MSLYREGQEVVFRLPTTFEGESRGVIQDIVTDSDLGAERDTYRVEVNENETRRAGNRYRIRNEHVVHVVRNADGLVVGTPGIEPQTFTLDLGEVDPFAEDNIFADPADENEFPEEEEDHGGEDQTEAEPAPRPIWGRVDEFQPQPNPNVGRRTAQEIIEAELERMRVLAADRPQVRYIRAEPAPNPATPEEVMPEIQATPTKKKRVVTSVVDMTLPTNAEVLNNAIGGTLPVGMLLVAGRMCPVYRYNETTRLNQAIAAIHTNDYTGRTDRDYYFTWPIPGSQTTIVPCYDPESNTVMYKTQGTEDYWTSECANHRILNTRCVRDFASVRWARTIDLNMWLERNGYKTASLPKKKLRRKYKEMPKIKEEKYYADRKEFIA